MDDVLGENAAGNQRQDFTLAKRVRRRISSKVGSTGDKNHYCKNQDSYSLVHGPSSVGTRLSGNLFAGEALEVGHLPFHFFARGVGGGADALDAELELVGIRCAQERFIECDELFAVEIEERLIERLHAVL